ncbi:MAG: ABC transporter permease [Gemmatimonadales bacterium]|nr:ABC transporter permease [Gemmatimonadales bacterium]
MSIPLPVPGATGGKESPWWMQRSTAPGLLLILGLLAMALLAPWLAPGDPAAMGEAGDRLAAPSSDHPMGTDLLGRDVLERLVHGSRVSLLVGWLSVLLSVFIGTGVGMAAGLGPHWLDRLLMGVTDMFLAFPRIFLVLLLVSLMRPSLLLVMGVLGLTGWMGVARLVRAEALSIRERDYIAAARGLGLGSWRVALFHVMPNLLPTVLVAATLRVGNAILTESFLSFLGLGVQEPMVSWGAMIQHGRGHLLEGWWLSTFPGLAIALTVVGYNLLGDGLRRHLDPRFPGRGGNHE